MDSVLAHGEAGGLAGQASPGREEELLAGTLIYPRWWPARPAPPFQPVTPVTPASPRPALPPVPCLRPTLVPVGWPTSARIWPSPPIPTLGLVLTSGWPFAWPLLSRFLTLSCSVTPSNLAWPPGTWRGPCWGWAPTCWCSQRLRCAFYVFISFNRVVCRELRRNVGSCRDAVGLRAAAPPEPHRMAHSVTGLGTEWRRWDVSESELISGTILDEAGRVGLLSRSLQSFWADSSDLLSVHSLALGGVTSISRHSDGLCPQRQHQR